MGVNPLLTKIAGITWIVMTVYGFLVINGVIPELIPGVF